jgi:hypothetical protein
MGTGPFHSENILYCEIFKRFSEFNGLFGMTQTRLQDMMTEIVRRGRYITSASKSLDMGMTMYNLDTIGLQEVNLTCDVSRVKENYFAIKTATRLKLGSTLFTEQYFKSVKR